MKTQTTIEKIIKRLRQLAIEFEELQVQAALGKAEAKDKHAEALTKLNGYFRDLQVNFYSIKKEGTEKYQELEALIESLRVQFALGKMEAKEVIVEKWKKFSNSLNELERRFKKNHNET